MNAKTDAQFGALVSGFRAGIPAPGPVDEVAAGRMLALMAKLGGEKLVGPLMELPDGIFYNSGS
jgi:NitT/TauT family transport system substrate-binding protein